jgi:DNA (cytosine-5)-methyltransferase 1
MHKENLNELALFAGAGGGILGNKLLGWTTICAVEWERYPASVLCARQNDGFFPPFPIWDDVQTFDGKPWRGIIDVVSGGFPCQDISAAGKGKGLDGERSGMWTHMARIISEVRPRYAFVENSPMLTTRGGTKVIADLTKIGYDCKWIVMGASDVGAPHQRKRIWILATDSSQQRCNIGIDNREKRQVLHNINWDAAQGESERKGRECGIGTASANVAKSDRAQCKGDKCTQRSQTEYSDIGSASWWDTEPNMGRVVDGVAARVDRLKAIGNGQVPLCAATAWRLLNA